MKKWDVVLVGSGISSLVAAALLGKKGKSVCVLEQHTKPGGYLHCFNRFGLRFDTGGHYLGALDPGQTFHTLLSYLGIFDAQLFVPLDPEGYDEFQFPNFKIAFPKGYEALTRRLSDCFPKEKSAITQYFEILKNIANEFPTYAFRPDFSEMDVLKSLDTSVQSVVESLTENKDLQACFYTYSTIHGVHPRDMSIGLHGLVSDSVISGSYGFRHGGDAFTQSFVQKIEEQGGKVITRAKVARFETLDKTITKIHLANGEELFADWIISGTHPKTTFSLMEKSEMKPAFRQRLENIKESGGLFGVYGYCDSPPPMSATKNYYFFNSNSPDEFLTTLHPDALPGAVYVTRTHRELQNETKFPITVHAPGPYEWFSDWSSTGFNKRPEEYHQLKDRVAKKAFQMIDRYLPGFGESIHEYETSTPLSNIHFNGSEGGSAYGVYHSIENTGWRALGPRTHIKNLLLTGQSTLSPGILGAAISGLRSAGHIIGIKPLLKELQEIKTQNGGRNY